MNVLEKILEEMKKIKDGNRKEKLYSKYPAKNKRQEILNIYSQGYEDGTDNFYNAMDSFIRSRMDDGKDTNVPSNWIPCSERLPDEHDSTFAIYKGTHLWSKSMFEKISDLVNVTYELEDRTRKTGTSYTLDGKWKIEKDRVVKRKVVAWQPLPEEYKGD